MQTAGAGRRHSTQPGCGADVGRRHTRSRPALPEEGAVIHWRTAYFAGVKTARENNVRLGEDAFILGR